MRHQKKGKDLIDEEKPGEKPKSEFENTIMRYMSNKTSTSTTINTSNSSLMERLANREKQGLLKYF